MPKAPAVRIRPLIVTHNVGERVPKLFLQNWTAAVVSSLANEALTASARRVLSSADEISLVFVSKKEIRRLNRTYRSKDKTTDVLSFAPTDDDSLGELVLCLAVINQQAFEHGLKKNEELGYMILHGVLHLLGYDHELSPRVEKQMFGIQDRVFEKLRAKI